jgi:hypothetical protein
MEEESFVYDEYYSEYDKYDYYIDKYNDIYTYNDDSSYIEEEVDDDEIAYKVARKIARELNEE